MPGHCVQGETVTPLFGGPPLSNWVGPPFPTLPTVHALLPILAAVTEQGHPRGKKKMIFNFKTFLSILVKTQSGLEINKGHMVTFCLQVLGFRQPRIYKQTLGAKKKHPSLKGPPSCDVWRLNPRVLSDPEAHFPRHGARTQPLALSPPEGALVASSPCWGGGSQD